MTMNAKGRPPKYSKDLVARIVELLEKGKYSYTRIAEKVGISRATFCAWKREREDFRAAVEEAERACREETAVKAYNSLRSKIEGFFKTETKTVSRLDPDTGSMRVVEIVENRRYFPPDPTAIIFALTNIDPENWKNRHNTEVTGKDGKDLLSLKSDAELEAEIAELARKLKG